MLQVSKGVKKEIETINGGKKTKCEKDYMKMRFNLMIIMIITL